MSTDAPGRRYTDRRFAVETLVARTGLVWGELSHPTQDGLNRALRAGGFSWLQADRWAVRFGTHPALIWADWLEDPHPDRCPCRACGGVERRGRAALPAAA